jgi:hypothetical protein
LTGVGQIVAVLPRLGHQHQLGGRRVAARAADRLEHRIQRRGVGCTRRDTGLMSSECVAERQRGHLDLVALHPVLVAADRVDLAVMGKHAERLRQPPLREGVGRIALVEDRDPADEALVLQIGIEDRQFPRGTAPCR